MTRNTKFYKVSSEELGDIYYRDLTSVELSVIGNIKNPVIKNEMAAELSIDNKDPQQVPFEIKIQIGEDAIYRSSRLLFDSAILDVTVSDMRTQIKEGDPIIAWISHITKYFPGTSVVDLLHLTPKDLVELVVLAEEMSGETIFGQKKKGMSLLNPSELPDGGKELRNQIKDLNQSIGIPR